MFQVSQNQKIGLALTGFGTFFLFLGIILLFDRALMALGNLLFIIGLVFIMGLKKTRKFFLNRKKLPGSIAFFFGIFLVLWGWPIFGMLIELFGIVNLFKNFFPKIISWSQYLPIIGPILQSQPVRNCMKRFRGPILPTYENKTTI
eukprot:164332_1